MNNEENVIEFSPSQGKEKLLDNLKEIDKKLAETKERLSHLRTLLMEVLEVNVFSKAEKEKDEKKLFDDNIIIELEKDIFETEKVIVKLEGMRDLLNETHSSLLSLDGRMIELLNAYRVFKDDNR